MRKGQAILALLSDRPVAYHPDIARITGGVKAAVFLCQLLFWTGREARTDGFIWKTQIEMEKETALTRSEQEGARKKLRALGILEEKRAGIPAKLHYRVDTNKLLQSIESFYSKQDCGKPANCKSQNLQTITETTTQTTSENTTEREGADAPPPPPHLSFLPLALEKMTVTAIKELTLTDNQWREVATLERARRARSGILKFITSHLNRPGPAVQKYREVTAYYPHKSLWKGITKAIGSVPADLARWERVIVNWLGCGWNPKNVSGMLGYYGRNEIPSTGNGRNGNGKARQTITTPRRTDVDGETIETGPPSLDPEDAARFRAARKERKERRAAGTEDTSLSDLCGQKLAQSEFGRRHARFRTVDPVPG